MAKAATETAAPDSEPVIVEREFELMKARNEKKVVLRIRRPAPDPQHRRRASCTFEIVGVGAKPIVNTGHGIDAIQACQLALRHAALALVTSPDYQSGRLTYQGRLNLQLPIHESYRCLLRPDLERRQVLRELHGKDARIKQLSKAHRERLHDKGRIWPDRAADAPVILERTYQLRQPGMESEVVVSFRKPVESRLGHRCAFAIEGLVDSPPGRTEVLGTDGIRAVTHAMEAVMTYLVMSPSYQRGQLTFRHQYDLGLPIRDDTEALVRKDLQARHIAIHILGALDPESDPTEAADPDPE